MKVFCLLILTISLGSVFTCNKLKIASFEIAFNNTEGDSVKFNIHYKNQSLAFHTLDETNISTTIFKLIWEFSSAAERTKATDMLSKISPYFEETKIDNEGLLINFFAYHMRVWKTIHKYEFGTLYKFQIVQKDSNVDVAFMIQKNDPNESMFEALIRKIFPETESKELKFLA